MAPNILHLKLAINLRLINVYNAKLRANEAMPQPDETAGPERKLDSFANLIRE